MQQSLLMPIPRLFVPRRRLVPHALLGLLVLCQPGAFATRTYWLLACGGMTYMNSTNARHGLDLLARRPDGKAHLE